MRTKIIATIGPKSENPKILERLMRGGMDIARMNFSHCTQQEFIKRIRAIKSLNKKMKKSVRIMQDLQGPRLRVGRIADEGVELHEGENIWFSTDHSVSDALFIDDPYLHLDITPKDPMFLANGAIECVVTDVRKALIRAKVVRGGKIFSHMAVNVPHTKLTTSGLTKKDMQDVRFALQHGVDFIALSFVQSAADVQKLSKVVNGKAKIIAKIERQVALQHMDAIIQAADGIMVARGDLGAELPIEDVPFVQKNLIRHAAWHGKSSIVATQMLFSMVDRPHPTRAEVSDIANAVWEGADAVMLSDETASGAYPVHAVETMRRIVEKTELFRVPKESRL